MNRTSLYVFLVLLNALTVLLYWLFRRFLGRPEKRGSYRLRCLAMLLCPVVGPCYFFLGWLFCRLFYRKPVDLEDVIFSKDRVKTYLKADEDKERDFVPLEEAIAVTDKGSTRSLMMEVVRRDISQSLSAISLALNSNDSEVSHYAASVLQETLGKLRLDFQRLFASIQKLEEAVSAEDTPEAPLRTEAGLEADRRLERARLREPEGEEEEYAFSPERDGGSREGEPAAEFYREEDIRSRTKKEAYAQGLLARDGPQEAEKDAYSLLLEEVDLARELIGQLYRVLRQKVFSPLEQESCAEMMEAVAELLDRRDLLSADELAEVSMQQLEQGKTELCRRWCSRSMELWPRHLSSYTCLLKLCFVTGCREEFFDTMEKLKRSGISLDHDTLELIRLFM